MYSNKYSRRRSFDCCTPSRRDDGLYDYQPTYGTYVWERRNKRDPADCPCTCCPHSYAGARRASGSRRGSTSMRYPHTFDYGSYEAEPRGLESRGHRRSEKPRIIDVVNELDSSQQRRFSLRISRDMTAHDILSLLAPDSRRYKVVVYWDDNTLETLNQRISIKELQKHASYLVVKKVKRVHWA